MKPTEISLWYRRCPPIPSSLSPINHFLSSMKFNGEVGVIMVPIDFAGSNLQEVVFEVLSEIDSPVGFQVTRGLHRVESPIAIAGFSSPIPPPSSIAIPQTL
ncbi:hypothetical protein RHGRI_017854 [Rhododendron griersonianum]|uniref:Uncharacterized protein n=1 Tax=Rhododendron griersonianum TaxID=479676 RepID=A0AAV6JZA2_9ERIC|nr:hypothetical protein RHGRI_017854 [Rhododendron griersonianum]